VIGYVARSFDRAEVVTLSSVAWLLRLMVGFDMYIGSILVPTVLIVAPNRQVFGGRLCLCCAFAEGRCPASL
jgi:hypothetical protein